MLVIGVICISFVLLLTLVGFFYTPYDINEMNEKAMAPSLLHLAGTDKLGRDIFSRLMVGARYTLLVAICTVLGSTVIGCILGMLSGYIGGFLDELIMRLTDAINSFPGILIALIVVTVLDYGNYTIILALCIMYIPSNTRIVRTGILHYIYSEFLKNSRVFGASDFRLVLVHIFPNIIPTLLPSIVVGLSNAILAESSMSYLGLGIQPPIPSWGYMLSEAKNSVFRMPWYAFAPGIMIMITIVGFHCIGEAIREKYT